MRCKRVYSECNTSDLSTKRLRLSMVKIGKTEEWIDERKHSKYNTN